MPSVDWNLFLQLGERHRVSGFLSRALRMQTSVPEGVAQALRERGERMERENLVQLALASKVRHAMDREGIPFLIMKGIPLAQTLYGSIAVRHSKDIDLLVDTEHLSAAQQVLREVGYRASSGLSRDLTPRQEASWKRHRKHYDYQHVATGVHMELHWRAFDNERLGSAAIKNAESVECSSGIWLPTLPRDEMFALLCAHGAGHAWFRLKWLVDVATMLRHCSPAEQEALFQSAQDRGLDRPAEQARLLCAGLFGEPEISTPGKSTALGRWLATVARDALEQKIPKGSTHTEFVPKGLAISRLLLRRGWVYRWEETKVYAASPADWKALRLPDWLHFAYPLVRIPLWLRRWWARRRNA